ncbi:MAG: FAD-dependent oxidoreductase, partial [Hyphomicrobiales bacterium]
MTVEDVDVAVIGAGPAGLSATAEAARLGASVTLIDDNRQPGGQYFRQPPAEFVAASDTLRDKDRARFDALCDGIGTGLVSYRPGATVWDVPDALTLALADGARSGRIQARAIVVAAGARDRAVAFPGWTLPGVMTAGGLQNLIKGMRIAPPGPAVVAGNGPLLLIAAASLVRAGVRVEAVVEAAKAPARAAWQAPRLAFAPSILRLAAEHRALLFKAGTPMLYGRTVIAAQGDPELGVVEIAAIDD